ncbi:MAG: hypothetical protein ABEL76_15890 [Bradymonadaceae bacterium]
MPDATPPERESDRERAKRYFWDAWGVARDRPWWFLWRLAVDGLRAAAAPLVAVGLLLYSSAWAGLRIEAGASPSRVAGRLLETVSSPFFVGATLGLAATAWLILSAVDSLVSGAVWGQIADASTGRDERSFLTAMVGEFPRAWPFQLLESTVIGGLGLLGALVGASVYVVLAASGPLELTVGRVALTTLVPFVYFVFAALVRLGFAVAPAAIFVGGRSVPAAVYRGLERTVTDLASLYQLVVVAAGILLGPLLLLWAIVLAQALTGGSGAGLLLGLARLAAQFAVFAAWSAVWVLFYGALFCFWPE